MIVIGVDVHKQAVTAVAVDEAGRPLGEKTVVVGSDELIAWAAALGSERLWALEDCRQLTVWLERQLLGCGEDLVRVPPKLTAPGAAGRHVTREIRLDRRARRCQSLAERAASRPTPGR